MAKAKRKEILGWCMFDVANSSYTTIIITVAFNVVFAQLIVGADSDDPSSYSRGNFLWSLVMATAALITAMSGPLMGALSDIGKRKKLFLGGSVAVCCISTSLLYFCDPGSIALAAALVVISNIGFSFSENFISAFLPHLVPVEKMGRVSGLAWGMGYFGGLGSIVVIQALTGLHYSLDNFANLKLIGPATAVFFALFSLPTFLFVSEPKISKKDETKSIKELVQSGYQSVLDTLHHLHDYRDLARFLISMLMFQAGVSIVISFAALYGTQEAGITGKWQAVFFITLQLSASAGAIAFGYIQNKIGALRSINITLVIWIITILLIYFLDIIADFLQVKETQVLFIAVGNLAGLCLGATQSCARAVVGMFSPQAKSGEFFGLWGLAGKFAAVLGIILFGFLQTIFSLKTAMLACCTFFVLGLLINQTVNEKAGIARAKKG